VVGGTGARGERGIRIDLICLLWVKLGWRSPINGRTWPIPVIAVYRRSGNLRAVQLLLGHSKIESTVRYLGIEVDDAIVSFEFWVWMQYASAEFNNDDLIQPLHLYAQSLAGCRTFFQF
jgi:hypothetical protein